jgi:hypothetical protein
MIKQEPKSIHEFKKGDKITRIQPSKPVMKMGDEEIVDRNFIGTPFVFVGIANGCIYLKKVVSEQALSFFNMFMEHPAEPPIINIELELFEDGWAHYVDPTTLGTEEAIPKLSIEELEKEKKEALEKEDYLTADRLQKLINKQKDG